MTIKGNRFTFREGRVNALRARLSSSGSHSIQGGNGKTTISSNPMFAATLHAAARSSKGYELSELETRMVNLMKNFSNDDEIGAFGRIYTEMKQDTLAFSSLSSACLSLDESTPYTVKNMVADAKAALPELLARPENKIVDISAVVAINVDGCIDDDEYLSALREAGTGITVITGPELKAEEPNTKAETQLGGPNGIPTSYKLTLERFKCHKQAVDGALGPRNEIYWGYASGSDSKAKRSRKTDEYGKVHTGDVLLRDISEYAMEASAQAMDSQGWGTDRGETKRSVAILALIGIIGALVAELLAWLSNEDDLVFRRDVAFTTEGLENWYMRPDRTLSFMFDGQDEGKHESWMTCQATYSNTAKPVPPKTGPIIGKTCESGVGWQDALKVAGSSPHGMSMVQSFVDLMGCFRTEDNSLWWTKRTHPKVKASDWTNPEEGKGPKSWTTPKLVPYAKSSHRPSIVNHNEVISVMYRTPNGQCQIISGSLDAWSSQPTSLGSCQNGPTLCSTGDYLVAVKTDTNSSVYWQVTKSVDSEWSGWAEVPRFRSYHSPALCVWRNALYMAVCGTNGFLYLGRGALSCCGWFFLVSSTNCLRSPSMAVLNGELTLIWMSNDNSLFMYYQDYAADGTVLRRATRPWLEFPTGEAGIFVFFDKWVSEDKLWFYFSSNFYKQ
ncbi:hypothetical protein BOTNAR_0842g00030 [Botryotinia narcissicola]|uniref:Uncharacterized protein n=1 Tax=Botryotinia narcissicola TaxID=278944 RepID=A0A4Z1H5L4_9HELO|nr:hypothetical protein BOTNAR_0842g00030 [Botryotinia narcissicola]